MGDWTTQNWTKRDGRNNQEQQQQQHEKKAKYKTAAELAVKNRSLLCKIECGFGNLMPHPTSFALRK